MLGDATVQVLSPSSSNYSDANNYSIAIRVVDGDTSFLFTGDAGHEAEQEICNTGLALDSDVYVLGHHGSDSSTSWDLLQKVTPEYAVLSCGAGNAYGHPHIESMEKLQAMGIQLLRTDKQGALVQQLMVIPLLGTRLHAMITHLAIAMMRRRNRPHSKVSRILSRPFKAPST